MLQASSSAARLRSDMIHVLTSAQRVWRDRTAALYVSRHHEPITTALSDYQRAADALLDAIREAEREAC